ncbi:hypothetical protein EVAR_12661_1 [Eumeta japonica]|uniref:Uncharacterized protein n=1 Tax=Eumeta variegata TaxID=151549 RepID=A0A4C1ZTQ7_EUMVA|nr:hypothetical protein EVAR_12661_1 [Eumeta japonica]
MDNPNSRGVISALPASWVGVRYLLVASLQANVCFLYNVEWIQNIFRSVPVAPVSRMSIDWRGLANDTPYLRAQTALRANTGKLTTPSRLLLYKVGRRYTLLA